MSPNRWSAKTLQRSGTILGVLSLLAFLGLGAWFWQASAASERADQAQTARLAVVELSGKNLANQLDEQRAQFEACKDAKPGTPGCATPVAPPAAQVAPQVVTGPIGPQGYPGPQGPQGVKGTQGIQGIFGVPGLSGTIGAPGAAGAAGADGTTGPAGETGAQGPAGADGATGAHGATGAPGEPPTSWTVTDSEGKTANCTRAKPFDSDAPTYVCTPTSSPTGAPAP